MNGREGIKRVLIVDDEPNVAMILAANLEKLGEGYDVDTAHSGDEALVKMEQTAYTLVLTDYKMPGLSGLDLARIVRQTSPSTRVVLMTAYGTDELRNITGQFNLDGYLDKPFTMAQIRKIVERAVSRTQDEQDPYRSGTQTLEQPVHDHLQALQSDTGARCVLLLSSSGYPVEIAGQTDGLDIPVLSALVAANFVAAAEIARQFGTSSIFRSSYHEGTDYNIYSYDLIGDLMLAVIFDSHSKPGTVWFYTKQTAATLEPLLKEQPPAADYVDDLAMAVDAGLDQLFDIGDDTPDTGQLMNLDDAVANGLLPPELLDKV